jgi:hypothetical protein
VMTVASSELFFFTHHFSPLTGQREQFGCVALNRAYDHMSVHVDCDGAVRTPRSTGLKSEEVRYNHDLTANYC